MVYGDLFLLVNALCDFFVLALTAQLLGRRPKPVRLIAGAAAGGVYALLHLYVAQMRALDLLLSALFSTAMVLIVFLPAKPKLLLRAFGAFCAVSALLGGGVTAFHGFLRKKTAPALSFFLLMLFLSAAGGIAAVGMKMNARRKRKRLMRVLLVKNGERFVFLALEDSGNLYIDCETGLPVALLSSSLFKKRPPPEERTIVLKTVAGQERFPCFLPDELKIGKKSVRALCAVLSDPAGFGGCPALLPAMLTD